MSEQSTKDVQVKGTKRDGVFDEYDHKIHRMGRIGTFVSLITWFLPAIGITLIYKVHLNWGQILAATIVVVSAFGLQGFFQPFTFFPCWGRAGPTCPSYSAMCRSSGFHAPQAVRKSWELIWGPRRGISWLP